MLEESLRSLSVNRVHADAMSSTTTGTRNSESHDKVLIAQAYFQKHF